MIDYLMRTDITHLKKPGKIIDVDVAGSAFKILLTPLLDGVVSGTGDDYVLVTLLQAPWYTYPFRIPLPDITGENYILEKLFRNDPQKLEDARKLTYLLKRIDI